LSLFRHWHAPIPELIAATPEERVLQSDIFDRPTLLRSTQRRVTLLGDAAHPMSPNLGQGACSALEDACVLAEELSRAASIPEGLRRYENARRLRVSSIGLASRALGWVIQRETPLATACRDLWLRATPEWLSALAMRPLFAFRLSD
jgi:2-polyprenyl-6-methoxyphenol hydroxylase-like FAD-dependent oxidoreductase